MRVRLIVLALLASGCAHNVAFQKPDQVAYDSRIPLAFAFYMDEAKRTQTYEGRAWSSGIVHKWVVPVGETAHQYADAYLRNAFQAFTEVKSEGERPAGSYLLKLDDLAYKMEGQAAHTTIIFSVESPTGNQLWKQSYSEDGPSGFGRVMAGGPFTQKSVIRQSSHVIFDAVFRKLIADLRSEYAKWLK